MDIKNLETNIGFIFSDPGLIRQAMRHRSYVNEQLQTGLEDNERLEFLGDAVLSLCVSHLLMTCYPELNEGILSKFRAGLVNDQSLAARSRKFRLGSFLQLGKGEELTLGRQKDSILAGAFEALLGAVYLDGGLAAALDVVTRFFHRDIKALSGSNISQDYKSTLQEYSQAEFKVAPVYEIIESFGPDHEKTFRYKVTAGSLQAEGVGRSKQAAHQMAAKNALKQIETSAENE